MDARALTPCAHEDEDIGECEAIQVEITEAVKVGLLSAKELLRVNFLVGLINGNVTRKGALPFSRL